MDLPSMRLCTPTMSYDTLSITFNTTSFAFADDSNSNVTNVEANPLSRDKVPRPETPCDKQAASLRASRSSGSEYLLFSVEIGS